METPTFYAIIPATVRYDKELTPNAKLLYGELTCLSSREGYCFATNSYFAEVYGVAEETISRWISNLKDRQYINIEYFYRGAEVKERRITMAEMQKDQLSVDEKINRTVDENVKGISTRVNTNNVVGNSDEFPTHKQPPFSEKEQKEIIGNMNKAHKRSLGDIDHTEPLTAAANLVSGKSKRSGKASAIPPEDLPMWNLILQKFRDGFMQLNGTSIPETGDFFGAAKTILKMKMPEEKFKSYMAFLFKMVGTHEKQYMYNGFTPRGFLGNFGNMSANLGGWTADEIRAATNGTATKDIWEKVRMK
jgi:hypothetical protein